MSAIEIKGPVGNIEADIQLPAVDKKIIGVICHPSSIDGGTLNNKVVTTLARTFNECGAIAIRFNFRGVGKSEGQYDNGNGEVDDVLAVIQWAKDHYPDYKLWLAGFSFGAYVSLKTGTIYKNIAQLISIAPSVGFRNFDTIQGEPDCPWLIVIPEKDELIDFNNTKKWLDNLKSKPDILFFPNTSHYFHGELINLRQQLIERLSHAHAL